MSSKWIKAMACTAIIAISGSQGAYAQEIVNMKLFYDGKMHQYKAQEVQVTIDGQKLAPSDMPPVIVDERTLVPVRAITEAMGAEVSWNADLKEAYITKNSDIVVLQLENKTGSKNGKTFTMDVPPKAINDRTMIPVRAFSEAFDCSVNWQESTRTVEISTTKEEPPAETPKPETPIEPPTETPKPETPKPETPKPETPKPETPKPETPTITTINVTDISLPTNTGDSVFKINASGKISKFEEVKLDDKRIVLDIHNAKKALPNDNITVSNHPFVSAIRSAEHDINGVKVTRVVLDLKASSGYTIAKSADEKSLLVTFPKNTVKNITLIPNAQADVLTINANAAVTATVSQLDSPRRLVINIPNCQGYEGGNIDVTGSRYVNSATVTQTDSSSLQLTLGLNAMVECTTSQNGNIFNINITKSTLNNMSYNTDTNVLTLSKSTPIDINSIKHTDNYLINNYKLTLPGNYDALYGYGTYTVSDDAIENILVQNQGGNTVFQFNTKTIRALTITEDANNYYFNVKSPREVYSKVLVIDAGHGLQDPGTSGNGFVEKTLNLQIATKVYEKMQEETGIKTYITRIDDTYPTNASRAKMANDVGDLFVSIHMNASGGSPITNGTELLYTPHSNESNDRLTSQVVATVLQQKLVAALGTNDRGIKNRPDLLVLNQTKVPAVIVEVVFLSNPGDALKISSSEGQEKAAEAIYQGVIELLNNYKLR